MGIKDLFFKKTIFLKVDCIEIDDQCHIINLRGHFDANGTIQAEKTILEITENSNGIIFNLNETRYVGSAGLRIFLFVAKKMKSKQCALHFCCLNTEVKKVFEISSFHTIMNIHESQDEAIQQMMREKMPVESLPGFSL
jgi:anti-sigma B factor antagonist